MMLGLNALILATRSGHLEVVKCLMDNGADPKDGKTAIYFAKLFGRYDIVEYLMERS